jgi:hypothetical protein
VAKLYFRNGMFLCRRCHQLAYASEREREMDRALRSVAKIRLRLGGNPDPMARFPRKPKGMQQRTYERLRRRYAEAKQRIDDALDERAAAIMARW